MQRSVKRLRHHQLYILRVLFGNLHVSPAPAERNQLSNFVCLFYICFHVAWKNEDTCTHAIHGALACRSKAVGRPQPWPGKSTWSDSSGKQNANVKTQIMIAVIYKQLQRVQTTCTSFKYAACTHAIQWQAQLRVSIWTSN